METKGGKSILPENCMLKGAICWIESARRF